MIIKNFYLRNDQDRWLRSLTGRASEHIRNAIDLYRTKIEKEQLKVSQSPSNE
jgi:hypothetical protein